MELLVAECKGYLESNLSSENFFDATKVAVQLNMNDLLVICKKFFKE
jgi:hypothetical protein